MGGKYGVKLVRGPVYNPEPHPLAVDSEEALRGLLRSAFTRQPRAVDLFCGAGGLSLGLEQAGFNVVLGVDTDPEALATHRSLCPGLSVDWDLSDPAVVDHVGELVDELDIQLVAGGPPCQPFSKAGRSMLRHLVKEGKRDAEDLRAQLWRSLMRVVEIGRPDAVLMENVPDMALDRDMLVLRTMTEELEEMGYSVEARLVDSFDYGVPQFRQRLLLVALADGRAFTWPDEVETPVRLIDAIGDLPPVEGGWRPEGGADGWMPYEPDTANGFVAEMRRWVPEEDAGRIHDHITRPVREDDRAAFAVMDPTTRYSELPEELRRYRDDIFDDKYKRLDWYQYCRTITAHIAKDGYWYIHPEQDRTLTVREAARVQTFPDHVRFAGSPTAAFRQIGNAVPPRAAFHVARAVRAAMTGGEPVPLVTQDVSERLALWIIDRWESDGVADPRHREVLDALCDGRHPDPALRWPVMASLLLLPKVDGQVLADSWTVLTTTLATPQAAVQDDPVLKLLASMAGREGRLEQVRQVRDALVDTPDGLATPEALEDLPGVSRALARLVCRIVPGADSDPVVVTAPLLRLAARFHGSTVDEQESLSAGRLSVARLIGVDDEEAPPPGRFRGALAGIALLELADRVCTPREPWCHGCPLLGGCAFAADHYKQPPLQDDAAAG